MLLDGPARILVDVTRDFDDQVGAWPSLDAVLLTHAHRDATGGIPKLARWLAGRQAAPVRVLAHPGTVEALHRRHRRLDRLAFETVVPGRTRRVGPVRVQPCEVPHATDAVTYAWRLRVGDVSVVYASDVATPTPELRRFARGAALLVVDGATWRRRIPSHLRVDQDLPGLCDWDVGGILLTQIGRSAPPHPELARRVRAICPRATPAHDGLALTL